MRSKRYRRRLIGAGVLALSGLAVATLGPAWASTARSTSSHGSTSAPATAAATGDPLPDRIVGGYWQIEPLPDEDANGKDRETGSAHLTVADITKGAPQYNLLFASFAYLHKGDYGVAFYPPKSDEPKVDPKAEIAASRAAGARWMLSVGGDGGTVPLSSGADAAKLVGQLVSIVDEYGFDGVDFDVECKASEGDTCWTKDAMREAVLGLKKHYQDRHFLISFAPSPASRQYRDLAGELGDNLDLFGYQFYDSTDFKEAGNLKKYFGERVKDALDAGIAPCKIMLGAATYSRYESKFSRVGNTLEAYRAAFDEGNVVVSNYLKANPDRQRLTQGCAKPELRGSFVWNVNLDRRDGYAFAKGMGPTARRS